MPMQFRQTYEGPLERWIDLKDRDLGQGIRAVDSFTTLDVPVDLTSFADHAKEINMAPDWKEATEKITRSMVLLSQSIQDLKLTLNTNKAEHIPAF